MVSRSSAEPPSTGPPSPPLARRLAAVLAVDAVGYSALMGDAEEETHLLVGGLLTHVIREIEAAGGRVFGTAGDGLMAEFPSAVQALKCALRVQSESARRDAGKRIMLRIGVNAGEIVAQGGRTGGTAVNIAARLEALAEPGGICLSGAVFEQVRRVVAADYESAGQRRLKNIPDPVAVYQIGPAACAAWSRSPALPRRSAQVPASRREDDRPSLAVLPFRTVPGQLNDDYFAEGMIDDIIRALSGLKDLLVVSRSATLGYARLPLNLRRAGHELDVRYVLHGSVRRGHGMLRIAAELCEAANGHVLWADRIDGAADDIFSLQDDIAVRVVGAIAPHVRGFELNRSRRKGPESMTAYDLTLQALELLYRLDQQSVIRARDLLEQASRSDPAYSPAYSHLASAIMRLIGQEWSDDVSADRAAAVRAARIAIERDPSDSLGLAVYGHLHSYLLHDHITAHAYLTRAVAAGPSCAPAWAYSSLTSGYLGDVATAIERAAYAVRLSPIGEDAHWFEHFLSQAYYLAARYDEAIAWGRLAATHAPANTSNLRCLIAALVATQATGEADVRAQELLRLSPAFSLTMFRARTPLRGDVQDMFVQRLRLAGLPE